MPVLIFSNSSEISDIKDHFTLEPITSCGLFHHYSLPTLPTPGVSWSFSPGFITSPLSPPSEVKTQTPNHGTSRECLPTGVFYFRSGSQMSACTTTPWRACSNPVGPSLEFLFQWLWSGILEFAFLAVPRWMLLLAGVGGTL